MGYRSGTYIAFDGLGQINPTSSDFKYYATIQAWAKNKSIDFKYVNSHDKTCAVRDTSLKETLKARIRERLSNSKNVVVILSSDTRKSGSMLSYEIEQAVDTHELPLMITYVDYQVILQPRLLSNYWPNSLSSRIGNAQGNMIHIPFAQKPMMDALHRFTINGEKPNGVVYGFYNAQAHRNWGLLHSSSEEKNILK